MALSANELLLIAAIVLVLFGGAWLPRLARRAGRAKTAAEPIRQQVAAASAAHARYERQIRSAGRAVNKARRFIP